MVGFTIVLGRKRNYFTRRKNKINFKIKKQYFVLTVLLISAVIGVSFFSSKKEEQTETVEVTTRSFNAFKEINDYSEYYLPIVMADFTSYKKGEKIGNDTVIKLGIWSILSAKSKKDYETFGGKLYIPKKDLEERVSSFFQDDIKVENKSINDKNYSIVFDRNTECYIVPTIGFSPEFTPVLESVSVKNNNTILTVGYLRGENYKQDSSGNTVAPEAEKRIFINLKKSEDGYYIEAVSGE